MHFKGSSAAVAIFAAAAATVAIPAGSPAQDQTKPVPCTGMAATDPAGDQIIGPVLGAFPLNGTPVTKKGPDNMDVTGLFFNSHTKDGKTVTTANIEIFKIDKSIPPEA